MNRRTKILLLVLVGFSIISLISMSQMASQHRQNIKNIDLLSMTNQKRNSDNFPQQQTAATTPSLSDDDDDNINNKNNAEIENPSNRPSASQIILISSAIGLEPGSRVNRHRESSNNNNLQQQPQSGNPFRRQPKSAYSSTVSFIQQHLHGMTDYLKHVYASHHGYNYILEGDEDFDEHSVVSKFGPTLSLALVDYARVSLLEKRLLHG